MTMKTDTQSVIVARGRKQYDAKAFKRRKARKILAKYKEMIKEYRPDNSMWRFEDKEEYETIVMKQNEIM